MAVLTCFSLSVLLTLIYVSVLSQTSLKHRKAKLNLSSLGNQSLGPFTSTPGFFFIHEDMHTK